MVALMRLGFSPQVLFLPGIGANRWVRRRSGLQSSSAQAVEHPGPDRISSIAAGKPPRARCRLYGRESLKVLKLIIVFCAVMLLPAIGQVMAEEPGGGLAAVRGGASGPIVIHANALEADNANKKITFNGDVRAEREDFIINCQTMVVHYTGKAAEAAGADRKPEGGIDRIVAIGGVRIERVQGGTATSDEAVYYEKEGKVILTGNPVLKQANDVIEGERVVFFMNDDRVVVEGSEAKRVKAVVFPRDDAERE